MLNNTEQKIAETVALLITELHREQLRITGTTYSDTQRDAELRRIKRRLSRKGRRLLNGITLSDQTIPLRDFTKETQRQ
jgi:hypothetical protein